MMKRILLLAVAAVVALSAAGQTTLKPEDIPKDFTDQKPFDLETGNEAAVLKGKGVFFSLANEVSTAPLPATTSNSKPIVPWTPFVSYDVNAQYNYTDRTKRVADLGVKPAIVKGWFSAGDPFDPKVLVTRRSLMPYLDLRSRSTDQAASSSTTAGNDSQKSFVYGGAGLQFRQEFKTLLRWQSLTGQDLEQPTLGVTYYKKFSGELPKDAPTGFDAIKAALTFDVPIPLTANLGSAAKFRKEFDAFLAAAQEAAKTGAPLPEAPKRPSFPFTFSVELTASRPTQTTTTHTIEHSADLALKMIQENSKIGYVLRYRTGKDLGFEYDRKLLAGILMRLFK
jgi:hypothetical protein